MTQPRTQPWYRRYQEFQTELQNKATQFKTLCEGLNVDPNVALISVQRDIIARSVQESNRQENIELDYGTTREIVDLVIEGTEAIKGPHIDFGQVIDSHRKDVLELKRKKVPFERIAAFNLIRAHLAVEWITNDLQIRLISNLIKASEAVISSVSGTNDEELSRTVKQLRDRTRDVLISSNPVTWPLTTDFKTTGQLMEELKQLSSDDLGNPFQIAYINFLHSITMMGLTKTSNLGCFRKQQVHVGNPDLVFPPSIALSELLSRYCTDFPFGVPMFAKNDPVFLAAKYSHRFVAIHPYLDGNGRVSRLLMNLLLCGRHPFVYLKADKKGKRRYIYALRRADRDDYTPLAALIAMHLIEVYSLINNSLKTSKPKQHEEK